MLEREKPFSECPYCGERMVTLSYNKHRERHIREFDAMNPEEKEKFLERYLP